MRYIPNMKIRRYQIMIHESFNKWGRCDNVVPVLGGDGTNITPPGDIFD